MAQLPTTADLTLVLQAKGIETIRKDVVAAAERLLSVEELDTVPVRRVLESDRDTQYAIYDEEGHYWMAVGPTTAARHFVRGCELRKIAR